MPEEERKITLYYTVWCGHCELFKKKSWLEIKERIDKLRKTNKDISYAEYDAEKIPEDAPENVKEEASKLTGYPTINITIGDRTFEYSGDRTVDAIMDTLLTSNVPQEGEVTDKDAQKYGFCGGARLSKSKRLTNNEYRIKYAKYKAKYFKLMSTFQF